MLLPAPSLPFIAGIIMSLLSQHTLLLGSEDPNLSVKFTRSHDVDVTSGWAILCLETKVSWGQETVQQQFLKVCCCCSVAKSCLTLCDPMDCSTPGFPVPHYLLKFAQTHVHLVSDAVQPSHPLSSPSPLAVNLS